MPFVITIDESELSESEREFHKQCALRHKLGVSQLKLSRQLGVDAVRIHDYETGKREPNLMVLLRYARLSKVSVESLIDDEMNLPQPPLVLGDKVWCPRCGEYVNSRKSRRRCKDRRCGSTERSTIM